MEAKSLRCQTSPCLTESLLNWIIKTAWRNSRKLKLDANILGCSVGVGVPRGHQYMSSSSTGTVGENNLISCMPDVRETVASREEKKNNSLVAFWLALGEEECSTYVKIIRRIIRFLFPWFNSDEMGLASQKQRKASVNGELCQRVIKHQAWRSSEESFCWRYQKHYVLKNINCRSYICQEVLTQTSIYTHARAGGWSIHVGGLGQNYTWILKLFFIALVK